jgi:hypothetical protein
MVSNKLTDWLIDNNKVSKSAGLPHFGGNFGGNHEYVFSYYDINGKFRGMYNIKDFGEVLFKLTDKDLNSLLTLSRSEKLKILKKL